MTILNVSIPADSLRHVPPRYLLVAGVDSGFRRNDDGGGMKYARVQYL